MKVIARHRKSYRTSELIKEASESGAYIVCPTHEDARRIFQQAIELNLGILFPVSWNEFLRRGVYLQGAKGGFMFDDLDRCLQMMCPGVEIKAVVLECEM
jgi:hypothetical protein